MDSLNHKVALVTGANRGLGRVFCRGLLNAGIGKIYAGARSPSDIDSAENRITPIKLDVTSAGEIQGAAKACADVDLLINNAGILHNSPVLAESAEIAARAEMEVNYFGILGMVRAFAPILIRNGGGTIVNVLSVASWFSNPSMATYCASKAAAMALTNALRIELRSQHVQVVGVYAGYIDTDMAAHVDFPKTSPEQVVERTLQELIRGTEHVFADERATEIDRLVRTEPATLYANIQRRWDDAQSQARN
jgi:NAD(P)-dependent dehydrogenase (short-subunit alcohol dehydrogenase family)